MVRFRGVRPSDNYFEAMTRYLKENGLIQTSQKFSAIHALLNEQPGIDPSLPTLVRPILEDLLDQLAQELQQAIPVPDNVRDAGIGIAHSLLPERDFFVIDAVSSIAPKEPPEERIQGGWTIGPYPVIVRRNMRAAHEVLGAFVRSGSPRTLRFYGMCFAFLLLVESSIVPAGRKLYAAYLASKKGLPYVKKRRKTFRQMTLGMLGKNFDKDEATRGLLDETYANLRNSIGHASFMYEEDVDMAYFVPLQGETWAEIAEKSLHISLPELERIIYNASSLAKFLDLVYSIVRLTDLLVVKIVRDPPTR